MSQSRVLDVVAAVIEREGMVLACRRRPEKAAGGKWEFPGGKIERDETSEAALVREIQEELETAVEITRHLRTDETQVGDTVIRLACFRARLLGAAPTRSSDHDEIRWVMLVDLPALDWAAPDLPAVAELSSAAPSQ